MAKTEKLSAKKRTIFGRKVKKLRSQGLLPANIYGKKIKSQAITVSTKDFLQIFSKVGETSLVELTVVGNSKPRPSLISNIQIHPVTDEPLHVDFHQVDLTQKVTARVPVHLIGESSAVKDKGAVLINLYDEVEVEALPTDLPDKFELDISRLKEFGNSLTAKDLKVDSKKVAIKLNEDEAIVIAQEPKEEEEVAPAPAPETDKETAAEADEKEVEKEAEKEVEKEADSKAEAKTEKKES